MRRPESSVTSKVTDRLGVAVFFGRTWADLIDEAGLLREREGGGSRYAEPSLAQPLHVIIRARSIIVLNGLPIIRRPQTSHRAMRVTPNCF